MELIKKISNNPKLVAFCNKILTYNAIFDAEESRHLFLASLISADTLVDEESCRETLDTVCFIRDHMDLFQLEENVREDIESHIKEAVEIAFNELREFRKERKE